MNIQNNLTVAQLSNQKGFSLIEILITLVIISVLASVAAPAYQEYVQQTYAEAAKSDVTEMLFSQERYFSENQEYADTLAKIGAPGILSRNSETIYTYSLKGCGSGGDTDFSDCVQIIATASSTQSAFGSMSANSFGERKFTSGKNSGKDW